MRDKALFESGGDKEESDMNSRFQLRELWKN